MAVRSDWTLDELQKLYAMPLIELISKAHRVYLQFHTPGEVQVCRLISVKTGGCPENCKYCSQSVYNKTAVAPLPMMSYEEVLAAAEEAAASGATRVCLGAAWREVRDSRQFDELLRMVKAIAALGVEVCCTLGMIKRHQAERLKEAGAYAYNHNLDSSERFYPHFVTTRTYKDRLETLDRVEEAGLSLCCGGILGMGEEPVDRLELLLALCTRAPHPESVPINLLSPIEGTPLEGQPTLSIWELLPLVALARITMPKAMVRLSCGRERLSAEAQALCFLAGANALFTGEKLLTVANAPVDKDEKLFALLGLKKRPSYSVEAGHG